MADASSNPEVDGTKADGAPPNSVSPVTNPPLAVTLVGQPPPPVVDEKAKQEEWWWKKMWKKEHAEVTGMYLDIVLRLLMCGALLYICYSWLNRVCEIVEKQAEENHKQLSDPVLIALLTTTTANILGLLLIVVGYLFPKQITDKKG